MRRVAVTRICAPVAAARPTQNRVIRRRHSAAKGAFSCKAFFTFAASSPAWSANKSRWAWLGAARRRWHRPSAIARATHSSSGRSPVSSQSGQGFGCRPIGPNMPICAGSFFEPRYRLRAQSSKPHLQSGKGSTSRAVAVQARLEVLSWWMLRSPPLMGQRCFSKVLTRPLNRATQDRSAT